jgi:hypothetical protein
MLNDQAQAGGRERHRLDLFRPNQIVFVVTHQTIVNEQHPVGTLQEWVDKLSSQMSEDQVLSNTPAERFVAELCEQLNNDEHLPANVLNPWTEKVKGQLSELGWDLVDPQPRSYSFPPVTTGELEEVPSEHQQELFPSAFSIIVCNVRKNETEIDNNTVDEDETDLAKVNRKRAKNKQNLLDLTSVLDQPGMHESLTTAELTVEAVTPNWTISGAKSDSGGTGGPGGKPVPYTGTGSAKRIGYYFKDLITKLKNEGEYNDPDGTNLYGEGNGVDVVILDTAPSGDDLVLAYKELVLRKKPLQKHPILRSLLGTDGLLKLYPATFEERRRMGNTSLNKHGYKMADHGLFIAGIINSIVPKATIHLVEVLNRYGVGDIETIARGFAKAYAIYRESQQPLVVNCSLCLRLPDLAEEFAYEETPEETIDPLDKDIEKRLRKQMQDELDQLEQAHPQVDTKVLLDDLRWVIHLRAMCERLGKAGRQVVAAAGNDSKKKQGGQRNSQAARYPAALIKVIGVGALPKGDPTSNSREVSSFSNLADKPQQNGIMALGGESGVRKGVLGLYLGEFPEVSQEAGQTTEPNDDDEVDADKTIQPAANQTDNNIGWSQDPSNNKNGWAWWAGTSFATPILTATIASVLSAPSPSRTTQNALGRLYTAGVIINKWTPEEEDSMPLSVKQDVNPLLQSL